VTGLQPSNRRAALRLTYACDNACVFCAQAGIDAPALSDPFAELAELAEDHDEISFVGGEPALDPRLPELITRARELGFSAIGLQTNARRLAAEPDCFDRLIAAGLDDLHLSIHAASPEAHDYHTGRSGSFAACFEVLARAQRAAVTVVASTVITRSNFRELAKLPPVLKRRGIAAWLLEPVRPYGRAADGFARVVPRFGMALPWALHALEQARRHDLSAWIRGAPLCALGPFAASALPDERSGSRPGEWFPAPCVECPARERCGGVDPAYVEVFGSAELSPRPARALTNFDEGRAQLMRMFVGIGPRVDRPPQLRSPTTEPEPASGKNRRLPVLANTPDERADSDAET
jgi:organic radical activating enzyme